MRTRPNPAEALVTLPRLEDAGARRAAFRQAITALSQSVGLVGPPPLDGVNDDILEVGAQLALDTGLADDLEWISPGAAAVALYELTAALPQGRCRRELGRRVFARLYEGTAATFAAVAARMALGSGRSLEVPTLRARVNLVLDLPAGTSVNAGALALTIATRSELHERWIRRPSIGALPARRLAAKLLEHASREAMMRAQQGDPYARIAMRRPELKLSLKRLLMDREPLVWQHAACARGLLGIVDPEVQEEIELALDPALSPTEWRRAAVSLVASLVGNSEEAHRSCLRLLEGELIARDPGLPATMVLGLPRVLEAETELAESFLERLSEFCRPDVAEAAAKLLSDSGLSNVAPKAVEGFRKVLAKQAKDRASILRGVAARALNLLDPERVEEGVHDPIKRALLAYEHTGARAAHDLAVGAIAEAHGALDFIQAHSIADEEQLPAVLGALDEVDTAALERSRLSDLLLLGRGPGDSDASVPAMERLYNSMGRWLLDGEASADEGEWTRSGALASQRRLRALLHLVDSETVGGTDESGVRPRLRRSIRVLLQRLSTRPDALIHRVLCAALARTFDAAVREGVAQPSELLLLVAQHVDDHHSVQTVAEASTNPHVSGPLAAYARFIDPDLSDSGGDGSDAPTDPAFDIASLKRAEAEDARNNALKVIGLSQGLSSDGSYRAEGLRRVVFRLGRALEAIAVARGLSDIIDASSSDREVMSELELAADALRRLCASANRRLLGKKASEIVVETDVAPMSVLVERAVRAGVPANAQQMGMAAAELTADLPGPIASLIAQVLSRMQTLPAAPSSDMYAIPLEKRRAPLPDWLLPRRTIGAFYVVRPLGSGGVSSVFVSRRIEERHNSKAESFALKVPEYDPTTARSLSEQEFLQLFREEAGALLSLPQHQNLARFVTFDLAARPKPILVMELIRGTSLERLIRTRSLGTDRVFSYLDGILAGLEAMHAVDVGHLDIKPSNVILRGGENPVLVDFGLSGRHMRPGCGTLEYCAPEVLGVVPEGYVPPPAAADMYAFACTAYELLTGELLFDADDEMALVSEQVSHDGWPDKLARFGAEAEYASLAVILGGCLRRDPRQRPTAKETRAALRGVARTLSQQPWPLRVRQAADISA